jgi:tRNA pseudouridine38-40 synthase
VGGLAPLSRLRLDLAYDGTGFAGWAAQRDQRTVQGDLESALARVTRCPDLPHLVVAGRTDAGVHARGQVAHLDLPVAAGLDWDEAHDIDEPADRDVLTPARLARRLNGSLAHDVRVRAVTLAPEGFDARFSALARTYAYRVADHPGAVDPLRRHDTLVWPRPLDLVALTHASAALVGLRDFAAYCKRREGATTVRALNRLDWERLADGTLVATVQADAFCHSMVRSLVGALLAVGDGRRPPEWPGSLLSLGMRASGVVVAPPHGLTLEHVAYPPDDQLAARQAITRNPRA